MNQHFKAWCRVGALFLLGAGWVALTLARPLSPPPGLQADGLPALQRVAAAGAEAPVLRFLGWHPQRREMLVLASAGGSLQLHRLAEPGARPQPLTGGRERVDSAQWEPRRGEYLVFSRDRGGDEAFRLYRLQPPEANSARLADPQPLTPAGARVSAFQFLPQEEGLVYVLDELDGSRNPAPSDALEADAEDAAAAPSPRTRSSRSQLFWMDPTRPESARLLGDTVGGRYTDLRISAAGTVLALHTLKGRSQTLRFDLDPAAAPGGQALGGGSQAEGRDDELLLQRQALNGDFRQLVQLQLATGQRRAVNLPELAGDLEALALPPVGSTMPLALVHNEAGVSVLRLARLGSEQPLQRVAADLPAGVIQGPQWHPRLPLLAFNHASAQSPGRIVTWSPEAPGLQAWSGREEGATSGLDYASLRWKSFDGLEISGLHIAPPAHFKGPRPVFISIHGGPSAQARPTHLSGSLRYLVETLGMHLILPNVRGSEGFGQRFLKLDNGRRREDAVRDISALLDLIASRPEMDARRVIVSGGSYGGYMSLAVATHESARIAGSICRVGIANFVSFLENTESYRRDNRRAEYGDERDPEMRAFLQGISPLSRAAAVRKPLFIVHGRNDPRVPYGEALQMVAAVRAAGTPVWFLTAEDEGHSFSRAENRDFLFSATVAFVQQALAAVPPDAEPVAADADVSSDLPQRSKAGAK
ncbi:prolyl oligopeptidase family serine peptidase [Paucibacter sp. DJ1R-11]|uniref:S9 family peptidase n=1 Tax=Paucibacter sp. DJ1R-11 TaxID=2893556 RepID=UPI0021E47CE2|nr:prolyl oligopeptidase family serine peptidase [Paucibacter sp. DJ1R-11]MCV2364968.1 prolyl oligopeptidase family serine peptidase [Paucibacter sp. DJ1R-11]